VHTAIPGFTTLDQLQTDLDVLRDPTLTDDEKRSLEAPKLAGFFCQGCDQCLDPCWENSRFRADAFFMYAHAYRKSRSRAGAAARTRPAGVSLR